MCPGPAFVAAAYGLPSVACIFLPSVAVGMKVSRYVRVGSHVRQSENVTNRVVFVRSRTSLLTPGLSEVLELLDG